MFSNRFLIFYFLLVSILLACEEAPKSKIEQKVELSDTIFMKPSERIFYNVFVRSFFDSNNDGIGDLNGVTQKLDYLKSLGINGLWLSPIHPSESYHKYDVKDYYGIDPEFGTLDDFKRLLAEAKKRDIYVLMDLVINHTDDNHPWFEKALAGDEHYRKYYNWATPESITEDQKNWHQQPPDGGVNESNEKFYGFFWKGMPDLNFDYPPVRESVKAIARFWLEDIGVDGFRLDAALHIYPFYESNGDQNMWKSIGWWEEFRAYAKSIKPDVFLVGEVWEKEEVVAEFSKNALDANFNFPLSEKILSNLKAGHDIEKLAKWLAAYRDELRSAQPKFADAIFLTNHDQNRIASELKGDTARLKLAASILLTLPGTPFLYYGEELGMQGEKPDDAIREPMIWHEPEEYLGQTNWQPIVYNLKTPPAAAQWKNPNSLLNHYKKLIAFRQMTPAMLRGDFSWLDFEGQPKGLFGYIRKLEGETVFVFHNLSERTINFDWIPVESNGLIFNHLGQVEAKGEKSKIRIGAQGTVVLKNE